jgi:hypothetical protein
MTYENATVWPLTDPNLKVNIGKLIVELVLGGKSIPDTPEKRIEMLKAYGIQFSGPVHDVEIHQSTPEHMHLTLPPRVFLERGVDLVQNNPEAYRPPPEYRDYTMQTVDALETKEMYYFRLGDYTLSHCR